MAYSYTMKQQVLEALDKIDKTLPDYKRYEQITEQFGIATDTPTAKARWVLIYIHFHIYSKVYKTNEFL